jgi:hypothetical protein
MLWPTTRSFPHGAIAKVQWGRNVLLPTWTTWWNWQLQETLNSNQTNLLTMLPLIPGRRVATRTLPVGCKNYIKKWVDWRCRNLKLALRAKRSRAHEQGDWRGDTRGDSSSKNVKPKNTVDCKKIAADSEFLQAKYEMDQSRLDREAGHKHIEDKQEHIRTRKRHNDHSPFELTLTTNLRIEPRQ